MSIHFLQLSFCAAKPSEQPLRLRGRGFDSQVQFAERRIHERTEER